MSATSSSFGSSPPREWQGPQTQTNRRDHGEKSSGLRFPFRGFSLPTALNTEFDTIKLRRWTELPQLCSLQGRPHTVAPLSPSVSGVPPSHTLRTTPIGPPSTAPAAMVLPPCKIAESQMSLVQGLANQTPATPATRETGSRAETDTQMDGPVPSSASAAKTRPQPDEAP